MSGQTATTFEAIAEKNIARLQRLGVVQNGQSIEIVLMQMMAALGELATFSYRSSLTLSPFEKEEAAAVLGKLAVSLTTIGSFLNVDVGAAALAAVTDDGMSGDGLPVTAAPPPRAVVLSPTSRENYFAYLDRLVGAPKSAFEQVDLRWVVPDEDGRLVELIPNGADAPVAYDLFPAYYDMVQARRREQGVARVQQQPSIIMEAPGYDANKEAKMFSPTHFSGGLFSPRAATSPSQLLGARVQPPAASSVGASRAASAERHRPHPQPPRESAPALAVEKRSPPLTAEGFDALVGHIRAGAVAGPQVASLGLTFCFPQGDQLVELVQDGMQIPVTAANATEFLRLYDEARRSSRAPAAERIHRMDSVRRLQPMVAAPLTDAASFSPSHFQHGLFAPFDTKPTYYVDYDAWESTLPPYLKLLGAQRRGAPAEQQQQQHHHHHHQQQQQQVAEPSRASSLTAPPNVSSDSVFMSAVRANDYGTLSRIIAEVRVAPRALSAYGVTFCVPSSLESSASAAERASGVHDLFPGSSERLVQASDLPIFLALVRPYFPAVLND